MPAAVNSTGGKDTAGLIVSDLYCDRCGWPLADDDRRIPMIKRVGLEHWRYYASQVPHWPTLVKLIFREPPELPPPGLPVERLHRQLRWLAWYGFTLSLVMVVLTLASLLGWGSPPLRMFLTGMGVGAVGVQIGFAIRLNRRLRWLTERL